MSIDDVLSGKAQFAVVCGDATAVMATLPDGCAAVSYTDPPYGLSAQSTENIVECLTTWLAGGVYTHKASGFMGSSWDAFTPGPEAWREVHRCLKPGGYCVAFSSTRTVDLLGIAVRLAGFEMREGLAWIGSQGFPKSLDVSRAIDKEAGAERVVTGFVDPRSTYDGVERTSDAINTNWREAEGRTDVRDMSKKAVSEAVTEAAKQWDGFGTTTKPAFEPLVVARKALDGTVAANVQKHGCGALNIDGARIGYEATQNAATNPLYRKMAGFKNDNAADSGSSSFSLKDGSGERRPVAAGRFPAALALVHDEGCVCEGTRRVQTADSGKPRHNGARPVTASKGAERARTTYGHADPDGMETVDAWTCTDTCAVAELGRQSGDRPSTLSRFGVGGPNPSSVVSDAGMFGGMGGLGSVYGDTGTAARFFYQAKASAADRLAYITCAEGCAHHESVAFQKDARDSARDPSREHPHGFCRACGGVRTHYQHPTVKPLDLAKYHARLLSLPPHTRPIALVPFCGTGIEARALLDVGFRVIAIDLDPRHCAMTTFRLTHKEPDHVTEEREAVAEAERGDWTKPIRVSEATTKAPVPAPRKEQIPLFGAK